MATRIGSGGGARGRSPFDAIRRVDTDPEHGEFEYWSAREAREYLGYSNWQTMQAAIHRAEVACRNCDEAVAQNFKRATKVSGSRGPASEDVQMSRFGMYLLAMNSDPSKPEVAHAQRYFALQTRRAEKLLDATLPPPPAPASSLDMRNWAARFGRTFMPHKMDLFRRHPGCFSVVTALVAEMLFFEDELLRHMMETRSMDRPDVSIGLTYAKRRRDRGMPPASRFARLYLPEQRIEADVSVYPGEDYGDFMVWFHGEYCPVKFPAYIDNKKEMKAYPALARASVADSVSMGLSGIPADIKPAMRAALKAVGGFSPAPALPPKRPPLLPRK